MFEKNGRTLLAKRKTLGTIQTTRTKKNQKMEGTLERHPLIQLGKFSKLSFENRPPSNAASSAFQSLLDSESSELRNQLGPVDADADCGEKEFILSQDFFW